MSMRTFILAVTGLVVSVAACSSYGTSVVEVNKTPAKVASVSVTVPSSLAAGQTARGVAITKDASGALLTGRSVTWFTSSASIASVTDSGMISAVAPGTAVVSALSEGVAGQATMAVTPPTPTPIATVSVAVTPSSVLIGQAAHATATLMDSTGKQILGRPITWQSSNSSIASVVQTGDVTAIGPGTAMISASSGGMSASSALSVSAPAPIPVASVSVTPVSANLLVGASVQLSAVTLDANNNVLTGRVIGWSSANTSIARVSASGLVTGVAAGNVSVTVSSEGQTASAAITVSATAPIPVASVSVSPATSSLLVGATVQLSATTRDASNNLLTGRVVTWSSGNSGIASVNSTSGLVTAVGAGSATITATSETKTGTATITVSVPAPAPVATVTVSPASSTLSVGAAVQLSAATRDASNNVLTGRVVAWSSADPTIASVNSTSGLVTAVAVGSTTITATSEGKSGSASVTVQLPPPPPPPGSSNEPSGMTLISERPFNSKTEDPKWDNYNSGPLTIEVDPTAPKSPSNVLRSTLPAGFQAGSSHGSTGLQFTGAGTLYISYWAKYSTNWEGQQADINKQAYAWVDENGGDGKFVMEASGVGSGTMRPRPILQSMIVGDGHKDPNLIPSQEIIRGVWFHIEIVLRGNTAGNADGSFDLWQDGNHCTSYSGLQWTNGDTHWYVFELQPIWGGTGGTVTNDMWIQWDHVYLSSK